MCLIIAQYPNSPRQTKELFEAAADLNKDGIGIAYSLNNQLIVQRGFSSLEKFIDYYDSIPVEASILIHFRAKSAGSLSEENLHPFIIDQNNLCFAFNGTISELNFKESDKSDTFIFNQIILQPLFNLNNSFYKEPAIHKLLNSYIKNGKMVFLDNEGHFIFINEILGDWDSKDNKQVWYSNKLWEKKIESLKYAKLYNHNTKRNRCKRQKDMCYLPHFPAPNISLNFTESSNSQYYRVGDKYYKPLTEDDLRNLSRHNGGMGIKKLKKKGIIARLAGISDEKRLEAYWKMKGLQDQSTQNEIDVTNNNMTYQPFLKLSNISEISDRELDEIGRLDNEGGSLK